MSFKPIQKLDVQRTLSNGAQVKLGTLAQNQQGVFFQYEREYVANFPHLSPFTLNFDTALQRAPKKPHQGLHGAFSDSLPDGWGSLLQNRVFRQHGILPALVTPMDRLAFVGNRGMGALSFSPVSEYAVTTEGDIDIATLGNEAAKIFDNQTGDVLNALIAAGSSGGARPKAQIYMPPNSNKTCRTQPKGDDEAWLIKFTSENLPLKHEEGLCEAVYLHLAGLAKLQPAEFQLIPAPANSNASAWLAVKRFDWVNNSEGTHGNLHMLSACAMLDADYRTPSLDYESLIKASRTLCQAPAVGLLQFRRAVFNLLACNQDDHSKNWAFLQTDNGAWEAAPFYDVTFSPHPFSEHATAYLGFGKKPPLSAMKKLAERAGYSSWKNAQLDIQLVADSLANFTQVAHDFGVAKQTTALIQKQLNRVYEDHKYLFPRFN
ncbi:type II toxin-antitoxin system HipA family toxin [Aliidiomarina iranensis]|uniref:Type II toxin-antitoxin system HipA family toxin n=1 Tax=Aliidiomarina iranensis TaxID=1434071 RepID=A0A432VWG6_9GAMM|nr:type II toxin-antitoxin system HipA family toxin [Aliidiomarina iranensis]RUO20893.1 type II toxin-antitoxin system HipA family toxin [Aliidiomarina iranensis]